MQRERILTFPGREPSDATARTGLTPSTGLLTAALAGFLALGASGCDEDENGNPICMAPTAPPAPAAPTGSTPPASSDADAGVHMPATTTVDASAPFVVTKETEGTVALAQLQTDCDARGGYIQVHAACAGANDCQGFSYHSGTPGTLTEHTCKAANGCTGASCVVGPSERATQRTGKEVYEDEDLPLGGPATCLNCHAVWGDKLADGTYPPADATKFKLFLPAGSARNLTNWLMLTPAEQEGIVAFGRTTSLPNGITLESMKPYHKLLSRGEIKRVVEHVRTLTPVLAEIPIPK